MGVWTAGTDTRLLLCHSVRNMIAQLSLLCVSVFVPVLPPLSGLQFPDHAEPRHGHGTQDQPAPTGNIRIDHLRCVHCCSAVLGRYIWLGHALAHLRWLVVMCARASGALAVQFCPLCVLTGVRVCADAILSIGSSLIIFVGSYSLYKCISKKAKTAAKMSKKLRAGMSKSTSKAQVHPL